MSSSQIIFQMVLKCQKKYWCLKPLTGYQIAEIYINSPQNCVVWEKLSCITKKSGPLKRRTTNTAYLSKNILLHYLSLLQCHLAKYPI